MTDTSAKSEKIRCDACPVMCNLADGKIGACDRYANHGGNLVRLDSLVVLERRIDEGGEVVSFLEDGNEWDGEVVKSTD